MEGLESVFERKFIASLQKIKNVYVPPKTDPGSIRGLPDRIICVNGRFVALEFKRNIKELRSPRSRLQEYTLDAITNAGGTAKFVTPDNADTILQLIKEISRL